MTPPFATLHKTADYNRTTVSRGEPPSVQAGADAVVVAATLFDWLAVNVTDAQKHEIATQVAVALGI